MMLHCNLECCAQSSSVTVPDPADLFGEEDTDSGLPLNNGSASSTPRASLQAEPVNVAPSASISNPPHYSTLQSAGPARPANTYENTPVPPASLPSDASSVSGSTIHNHLRMILNAASV